MCVGVGTRGARAARQRRCLRRATGGGRERSSRADRVASPSCCAKVRRWREEGHASRRWEGAIRGAILREGGIRGAILREGGILTLDVHLV